MDKIIVRKLFIKKLLSGIAIKVHVKGGSMNPVLKEGDIISIRKKEYMEGDILLFFYEDEELLVHRLLKITNNYCYCKGDNSFRLEKVLKNDILGIVEAINGKKVLGCSSAFLRESERMNDIFVKNNYDAERVIKTYEYKEYYEKYLAD